MKNLKDFIKVYDNVLDKNICKQIVEKTDESKFKKATVGNYTLKTDTRNCYITGIDKDFDKIIFESVGKVLTLYQNDIGTFADGAEGIDTGYEHLIYKGSEKGMYKTHTDHFGKEPRLLSISILLNNNFDGGNFCFFDEYIIEKKVGSAIAFPSNFMFPHSVLPVSNGDRHAIITWIR
tara:strand:+ start:443 stop:976 length:534 start_codon:yes stop_codon:yes gene_type:complete